MKRSFLLLLLASARFAGAQTPIDLISFEPDAKGYLPDGTLAVDELKLRSQYEATTGVSFGFDENHDLKIDRESFMLLEQVGNRDPHNAFVSNNGVSSQDSAAPGYESQLGDWFLKMPEDLGNKTFLITYDNPMSSVSGEIWDLDAKNNKEFEQLAVTAYAADGTILGRLESPVGITPRTTGSLDAKPWIWNFEVGGSSAIAMIGITNLGKLEASVGFNNFSGTTLVAVVASSVATPEVSFSLLAGSFLALSTLGRRRPVR